MFSPLLGAFLLEHGWDLNNVHAKAEGGCAGAASICLAPIWGLFYWNVVGI